MKWLWGGDLFSLISNHSLDFQIIFFSILDLFGVWSLPFQSSFALLEMKAFKDEVQSI